MKHLSEAGLFFFLLERMMGMSRFNKSNAKTDVTTYEGGEACEKPVLHQWLNLMFGSLLSGGFYESADTQARRLGELTEKVLKQEGPVFVSNAIAFARNKMGIRSASSYALAHLNGVQFEDKAERIRRCLRRPDDVAELFAAIDSLGQKRSHGTVNACRNYLEDLGDYSLSKYKMSGKDYNMYDLVNITHANSPAIDKLKSGELEPADTWETAVSNASDKGREWCRLVQERKLGYLALIRNLRNICKDAPHIDTRLLVEQIENEDAIRGSLVFPYQIYAAYQNARTCVSAEVAEALQNAFVVACENVPELPGKTLFVLDVSGSMSSPLSARSEITILEASACYCAVAATRSKDVTVAKFGTKAKLFSFDKGNPIFTEIELLCRNDGCGHGTQFDAIKSLGLPRGGFDRMFLFSDEQVMSPARCYIPSWGDNTDEREIALGLADHVYSFNLGGYSGGVLDMSNPNVLLLTGLSDKLFEMIPYFEDGTEQVRERINSFRALE